VLFTIKHPDSSALALDAVFIPNPTALKFRKLNNAGVAILEKVV
jgi:hypothetical protein